jgi:hypothetical protein
MNGDVERSMILKAIRLACEDAGQPWPPPRAGPVSLHRIINDGGILNHEEVPRLSPHTAAVRLGRAVDWGRGVDPARELAGLVIAGRDHGSIYVRREDPLARRRFTAAHELGHYHLHFAPTFGLGADEGDRVEVDAEVSEKPDPAVTAMERQANQFAAELLMPEGICRDLHARYARRYGGAARFIVHHLAGDLLVSKLAMQWRLYALGLGRRPERRGPAGSGRMT